MATGPATDSTWVCPLESGSCAEKFENLTCRAVSAQFMGQDLIAMFELTQEAGEVRVVDERHYRLVPADQISAEDLN